MHGVAYSAKTRRVLLIPGLLIPPKQGGFGKRRLPMLADRTDAIAFDSE